MFETGKYYQITTSDGPDRHTARYWVMDWEAPLLKIENMRCKQIIMNTNAPNFLEAELSQDQSSHLKSVDDWASGA